MRSGEGVRGQKDKYNSSGMPWMIVDKWTWDSEVQNSLGLEGMAMGRAYLKDLIVQSKLSLDKYLS